MFDSERGCLFSCHAADPVRTVSPVSFDKSSVDLILTMHRTTIQPEKDTTMTAKHNTDQSRIIGNNTSPK